MNTPPPLPPTSSLPTSPPPLPTVALSYATPNAVYAEQVAWREGNQLVVRKGAVLPPLCVRCNEPAEGNPIRRTYTWHTPALYLLILAGILIYAIVAVFVQEKAVVGVSLCARHRRRRLLIALMAWAMCLGGLAALVLAASMNEGWPAIAGIVLFLCGLILAIANQTLTAKKIDAHFAWLGGAGEAFLANFPGTGR